MCSIQFMNRLVPSALSLDELIIPLVCVRMKLLIWCNKSWIYCGVSCNLHVKGKATQAAAEATQMAEIAQDRAAKAIERERKFQASSVQAKEIAVRALK